MVSTHTKPKVHHYVPKLILRRFADTRGQLYFFDKRRPSKGLLASSPDKIFRETHLYSRIGPDGQKDVSLESDLSALESDAGPVLQKIISAAENGLLPKLTSKEKETVDRFHYYQYKRSPDLEERLGLFENFEKSIKRYADEFEEKYRPLKEAKRLLITDPEFLERAKQNAMVNAIATPGQHVLDAIGSTRHRTPDQRLPRATSASTKCCRTLPCDG